jgi:hypothetical protein
MAKIENFDLFRSRLKTGQLYFGDPEERRACVIWFRSPSEVLVEVTSDAPLPRKLRLISAALALNKPCEVISREGRQIRLRFDI